MATLSTRRLFGYAVLFLVFLSLSLLWTLPLGVVNRFLPPHQQLVQPTGNLSNGRWQDIRIHGKRYPLNCQYQRQSLAIAGITYQLNCSTPFATTATVTVSWRGDITVTNGTLSGDIAAAAPWLSLVNVPLKIAGAIGLTLNQASISQQTLTTLDINGSAASISVYGIALLKDVRINTINPTLSPTQPIEFEIRSSESSKHLRLYTNSQIDGRHYLTHGEVSGEALRQYGQLLAFFGQNINNQRLAIHLQGMLW